MTTFPDRVCQVALLALLLPVPALGEVIEFEVDPVESTIQVDSGNDLSIPLAMPLNSVTIPAVAPTSGTGGALIPCSIGVASFRTRLPHSWC